MPGDMIGTAIAARILGKSQRAVQLMCECDEFVTAARPGMGHRAHWSISRLEVRARKYGLPFNDKTTTNGRR